MYYRLPDITKWSFKKCNNLNIFSSSNETNDFSSNHSHNRTSFISKTTQDLNPLSKDLSLSEKNDNYNLNDDSRIENISKESEKDNFYDNYYN